MSRRRLMEPPHAGDRRGSRGAFVVPAGKGEFDRRPVDPVSALRSSCGGSRPRQHDRSEAYVPAPRARDGAGDHQPLEGAPRRFESRVALGRPIELHTTYLRSAPWAPAGIRSQLKPPCVWLASAGPSGPRTQGGLIAIALFGRPRTSPREVSAAARCVQGGLSWLPSRPVPAPATQTTVPAREVGAKEENHR